MNTKILHRTESKNKFWVVANLNFEFDPHLCPDQRYLRQIWHISEHKISDELNTGNGKGAQYVRT